MSIPKVIYQAYPGDKIPLYVKWEIWKLKKTHPPYKHVVYMDNMIDDLIKYNFNKQVYAQYSKLQNRVAKVNFFCYSILYFNGGIYMDSTSSIYNNLDKIIRLTDNAIITHEKGSKDRFAYWALIFERQHPILKKTLDIILDNISNQNYTNDIESATGTLPFSIAVQQYLKENPNNNNIRMVEDDYKGIFIRKNFLSKLCSLFRIPKKEKYISIYKS